MIRIGLVVATIAAGIVLMAFGLGIGWVLCLAGLVAAGVLAIVGSVRDGGMTNVPMGVTGQYGGFGGESGGRHPETERSQDPR